MADRKDFYEDDKILQDYLESRHNPESPNETLEKPAFLELLGNVQSKTILDLGCGDARFGVELLGKGCISYLGIEPSSKMLEFAHRNLQNTKGKAAQATIETWLYPPETFDVVISRLALHYVENLDEAFQNIYKTLKPSGRFVFSVLHPVITSFDTPREKGEVRSNWIVDDYFKQSSRQVRLRNDYVTQYHRTLETILMALQKAGFVLEGLREGSPKAENFRDEVLLGRRLRIPLFLILSSRKWAILESMNFTIDFEQETDGRWLAEIDDLPGVMVYGATKLEAMAKVQALALRVVADRLNEEI